MEDNKDTKKWARERKKLDVLRKKTKNPFANPQFLKNKKERITCVGCKNQTFVLTKCIDFPFFDLVCSKCGSIQVI